MKNKFTKQTVFQLGIGIFVGTLLYKIISAIFFEIGKVLC